MEILHYENIWSILILNYETAFEWLLNLILCKFINYGILKNY